MPQGTASSCVPKVALGAVGAGFATARIHTGF